MSESTAAQVRVPDEAVEAAAEAAYEALGLIPGSRYAFPQSVARTVAYAALAAAVPLIREQIAAEIEAVRAERFAEYGNEETGPRNYDWALTHAARIARGES